jgi:hypothetical protein
MTDPLLLTPSHFSPDEMDQSKQQRYQKVRDRFLNELEGWEEESSCLRNLPIKSGESLPGCELHSLRGGFCGSSFGS